MFRWCSATAGDRKHRLAEDYLAEHSVGAGVFLGPHRAGPGDGIEGQPHQHRGDPQPGQDPAAGQPLLLPRDGPDLGTAEDQDEWASPVRCSDHPQRPTNISAAPPKRLGSASPRRATALPASMTPSGWPRVAHTLSQPGTVGRLSQVLDRWIYTACLCFGLDLADQARSGFGYAYWIYQVEYSEQPDLLLRRGHPARLRHRGGPHPKPDRCAQTAHPVRGGATPAPNRRSGPVE